MVRSVEPATGGLEATLVDFGGMVLPLAQFMGDNFKTLFGTDVVDLTFWRTTEEGPATHLVTRSVVFERVEK